MKLEVRCCCQPQKLLGWLEFNHNDPHDQPPPHVKIARTANVYSLAPPEVIVLPIARINVGADTYFAIKAEGMTVEELLPVRGFTPANL